MAGKRQMGRTKGERAPQTLDIAATHIEEINVPSAEIPLEEIVPGTETGAQETPQMPSPERLQPSPPRQRNGAVAGLVLGGIAGAGFGTLAALVYPHIFPPAINPAMAELEARLSKAEQNLQQQKQVLSDASKPGIPSGAGGNTALDSRLDTLEKTLVSLKTAMPVASANVPGVAQDENARAATLKIDAATAELAEVKTRLSSGLQKLDTRIGELGNKQAALGGAALLSASETLRLAVDRGTPFENELGALETLGIPDGQLAILKPFSTSGAPTPRAMAERFRSLTPALLAAPDSRPSDGFLDRLKAASGNLVRVRATSEKSGSDPVSITSRLQAALDRGDFQTALTEANNLPEPAKARSLSFASEIAARAKLGATVRQIQQDALQRMRIAP